MLLHKTRQWQKAVKLSITVLELPFEVCQCFRANFNMSVPIVTNSVAMATVFLAFQEAHVKHTAFFLGAYVFTLLAVTYFRYFRFVRRLLLVRSGYRSVQLPIVNIKNTVCGSPRIPSDWRLVWYRVQKS